jgi:hypothetical protein
VNRLPRKMRRPSAVRRTRPRSQPLSPRPRSRTTPRRRKRQLELRRSLETPLAWPLTPLHLIRLYVYGLRSSRVEERDSWVRRIAETHPAVRSTRLPQTHRVDSIQTVAPPRVRKPSKAPCCFGRPRIVPPRPSVETKPRIPRTVQGAQARRAPPPPSLRGIERFVHRALRASRAPCIERSVASSAPCIERSVHRALRASSAPCIERFVHRALRGITLRGIAPLRRRIAAEQCDPSLRPDLSPANSGVTRGSAPSGVRLGMRRKRRAAEPTRQAAQARIRLEHGLGSSTDSAQARIRLKHRLGSSTDSAQARIRLKHGLGSSTDSARAGARLKHGLSECAGSDGGSNAGFG